MAVFDPTDIVQIQASVGLIRDNNLFRLPDLDPRLFGVSTDNKADTALIKALSLSVDKPVSRQRLIADLSLHESTYDKNTNLDFVGGDARLAWLWRVGSTWDGEVGYRTRRSLGGFADATAKVQDLIDTANYRVSAGFQFHPRWRVAAERHDEDQSHSAINRRSLDVHASSLGLSLTYRTAADNSLGVQARRTQRTYPNRLSVGPIFFDNNHTESRLNVTAAWRISGALQLDAQIGQVEVNHEQLTSRNFSDANWRAAATWDATAKSRIRVSTSKDVRLYEDIATSYVVVNAFGVAPSYALTPKLILQGDLVFEKRAFHGDPGFVSGAPNRDDTFRLARLTVTYAPRRNIDLALSHEAGERESSNFLNSFNYRSWFATFRARF